MKSYLHRIGKKPVKLITTCLFSLFLSGILFDSCIKKEDFDFNKLGGFEYQPNVAAPLIHSKLTLRDILADFDTSHLFVENATHFLYLIYNSTVFSQRADQIISIPDQYVNSNYNFSTGAIAISDSAITNQSTNYNFNVPSGGLLDSIFIKSGNLNFNINGNINHSARIYITIPGATKAGVTFNKTIYYNYTGSVPVLIGASFDLSGYKLSFNPANQLTINYKVAVYGDANPDNSPYNISMGESFNSLLYSKMFGYFGQLNFNLSQDSVFIQIFKNNISGNMFFMDPKLTVTANNALGMPIALTFGLVNAHSNVNAPFDIAINGEPSPWMITAPTFAQLGQSIATSFTLDQSNSNVKPAVNMSPRWISFVVNGLSNPLGNTGQNFVLDTSRFNVDMQVNLPLYGSAWNFKLQDTVNFSFGSDMSKLEWILFKINTDNGFPVDATMQIYFVDTNNVKIDSLLTPMQQVITSGSVGSPPDYKVISPTHKYTETYISGDRLANLDKVTKIFIFSKLATVNSGIDTVKFYSDYNVDVKIGAQVQAKTIVYPNHPNH